MLGSIVFLTPSAALVALAAVLPLGALALAGRRVRAARASLGLPAPPPVGLLSRAVLLAAVPVLLGVAAAQPAYRTRTTARVRTDAQAMFVLDTSRSMLARKGPHGVTRLARAEQDALAIREALPEVPSGVATFTDRVLPSLLPDADVADFENTVKKTIAIEEPPPDNVNVLATDLGNLGQLATGNYFVPTATKRLVVVLTDGESRPFDQTAVARAYARAHVHLVLVHVWANGEAVYDDGVLESGYHEDPTSGTVLDQLAAAAGGIAVDEHDVGAAIAAANKAVGSGPTVVTGRTEHTRTLAPFVALLALVPLLLLARGAVWRRLGAAAVVFARSRRSPVGNRAARLRHQ